MANPITALPTPPSTSDPANFDSRADNFLGALPDFADELNDFAASLNSLSTTTASTSSVAIGTGTKNFTVETGKSLFVGMSYRMAFDANNWMNGEIISYDSVTGALSLDVDATRGSGSYAAWVGTLSFNGQITTAQVEDQAIVASKLADDSVIARVLADSALGFALINGTITASVASSALTIAIKTKAGEDPSADDPVLCVFRNATLATGDYVVRSITAATSLVISSGSTLGTTSAVESQINVLAIDNAGTVELAVVNNAGSPDLSETGLISTSAEGGAGGADSNSTIYSTTARTNVAYRNIGYIVSTQATAGAWASAPTQIQLLSGPMSKGVLYTTEKSLSGTAVDFPDIPAWAKRITILLESASTNGTGQPLLQLGDTGGFETTGYAGGAWQGGASDSVAVSATGFALVATTTAGSSFSGAVVLYRQSGNKWIMSGGLSRNDGAGQLSAGNKTLSDVLNSLRLTALGSNSYDGGNAIVLVEG